jgi:serine/threonine-protein kinase
MEFLDGESLANRLRREGLPWSEAMQIWLQVASAVDAAHHQGIVHRDLKPDNIFLTPSPEGPFVKVLDFGIAKLLGDAPGITQTSVGTPIGTPTYMAPEQAMGAKVDARTDLYAFGVILFEVISGRPPFISPTLIQLLNDHINNPPPPLDTLGQGIDPELVELVHQLIAKEPSQRPANMSEVRRRLVAMRDRALSQGTPLYGTAMPASASGRRKAPVLLIAGGALATVLTVVALGTMGSRSAPPHVAPQPPVAVTPPAAPPSSGPRLGRVTISTNTSSTRVYLDPSAQERSATPIAAGGDHLRVSVPPNKDWILRVESDGYKPHTMPLRIGDGEETALPVVLTPDAPVRPPTIAASSHRRASSAEAKPQSPAAPRKVDNGKFLDPFENGN